MHHHKFYFTCPQANRHK
uniref:Uncharacterized protein n=1 Tax=Arundo donax TaxID=35708 RepID=A0A0A9GC14_ARUDO